MAIVDKREFTFGEFAHEMDEANRMIDELPIARDRQEVIRDVVYADISSHFDEAANAWGDAWAPHAPSTVRRYGPHPLLILSGKMKTAATTQGAEGNYEDVEDRSITFGVDIPYAQYHQFGTDNIPERSFFDLSETAIATIAADAGAYCVHEIIGY